MSQFRQLHEGGIDCQPEAGEQIVWTVTDSMLDELELEAQEMLKDDVV